MPPTSRSAVIDALNDSEGSRGGSRPYEDVCKLRSAEGLVAFISQKRWDGQFTLSIQREFERYDAHTKQMVTALTSFIPEELFDAYDAFYKVVMEEIVRLRELRAQGNRDLPFPEGGTGRLQAQRSK